MVRPLTLLTLLLTACSRGFTPPPPRPPGRECTFNGDCPARKVCADGQCRAECRTDRDCAPGALCRQSPVPGQRVCLPPEAPALCFFNSDCAAPFVCGADHHCHAPCRGDADCPTGRCDVAAGSCAADAPIVPDGGCVVCGARCVMLQSDPAHCGACETACPEGGSCVQGACVFGACADAGPCNNACSGATPLTLNPGRNTFSFDTTGRTAATHACGQQASGYYRFHLEQRSLVAAVIHLIGSTTGYSGGIGFLEDCAQSAAVNCAGSCGANPSRAVAAILAAGDHLLVVDHALRSPPQTTSFELNVTPLPPGLTVEALPSPASFTLTAHEQAGAGEAVCGSWPIAHAWLASSPCVTAQTAVLTISTCGSDPGVQAGFIDGATGTVLACSTSPDPACDGGAQLSVQLTEPDPVFVFGTLPPGADGGFIRLSGTLQ